MRNYTLIILSVLLVPRFTVSEEKYEDVSMVECEAKEDCLIFPSCRSGFMPEIYNKTWSHLRVETLCGMNLPQWPQGISETELKEHVICENRECKFDKFMNEKLKVITNG